MTDTVETSRQSGELLFDGRKGALKELIAQKRAKLTAVIEGMTDDEAATAAPTQILERVFAEYSINIASLDLSASSVRRMFHPIHNRTCDTIRVDIPFTGLATTFMMNLPPEAVEILGGKPPETVFNITWAFDAEKLVIYKALKDERRDATQDPAAAEEAAQEVGRQMALVIKVLAAYRGYAEQWNSEIPTVIRTTLARRKESIRQKAEFLDRFRENMLRAAGPLLTNSSASSF